MTNPADSECDTEIRKKDKIRIPAYRVIIHDNDHTPFEFVVALVAHVFHHALPEAVAITANVHEKGSACAGIYPYEIAETKQQSAIEHARRGGFDLRVTIEKEEE